LYELGRLDEAVAAYRQQLNVKPDHESAGDNLGIVFYELGRLDEAVAAYRQQLNVKPDHESAGNNLGIVFYELGRLDEAVAAYLQQLEVKPDHEYAGNNLGLALSKLGRLDEAVAAYLQQLEVKPDDELAWNRLGITYWQQGHLELAQQAFADTLKFNPQYLLALSNDAELALVQNDKTRCLQRIDSASALIDNKTQEYVILPFLAWLAEPDNAPDAVYRALEQLDKSVKITWDFADTEPAILCLTIEQQTIARQFIAAFQSNPS
jgi:tetratricopeptide (TPR) repeat protein